MKKLEALLTELQELEQERGVGEDMQEPMDDFGDDEGLDFEDERDFAEGMQDPLDDIDDVEGLDFGDDVEIQARETMTEEEQAEVDAMFDEHVSQMMQGEEDVSEKELDDELYDDDALDTADDGLGMRLKLL